MDEKFIKEILSRLMHSYPYRILEADERTEMLSTWGAVKEKTNELKQLVFFFNMKGALNKALTEDLKSKIDNNTVNVSMIKIIFLDNEEISQLNEGYINELRQSGSGFIIIDGSQRKIIGYSDVSEETLYEIYNSLGYTAGSDDKKSIPVVTYMVIGINILVFLITAFLSNNIFNIDINVLVNMGAKYNELISAGQYYRLFTCIFLHGGIVHIALNMYSLYAIGPLVERLFGKTKYIIIYLVSGLVSSTFSFLFSNGISIGASGAIFGLLGTVLIFAYKMRKEIGKDFLRNIVSVIIVNLIIGVSIPNIDNFAHIGGLIGGILVTSLFLIMNKSKAKLR